MLSETELQRIDVDSLIEMVFAGRSEEYRAQVAKGLREAHVRTALSFRETGAPELLACRVPEDACIVLVSKGLLKRESPKEHTMMGKEYCHDPERRVDMEIIQFLEDIRLPESAVETALSWLSKDENWVLPFADFPNFGGLLSVMAAAVPVKYNYKEQKPGPLDWFDGYLRYSFYRKEKLSWLMLVGGRLYYHACIGGLIVRMHQLFMQQPKRAFAYGVVVSVSDEGEGYFIQFFRFRFDNLWLPVATPRIAFAGFGLPLLMKMLCSETAKVGEELDDDDGVAGIVCDCMSPARSL